MFMAIVCLIAWQSTNNSMYEEPLKRSLEAEYSGSKLKNDLDNFVDKMKNKAPNIAKIGPIAYVVIVKKKAQFTSSKLTLIPGTTSSYQYENNTGSIKITWGF